MSDQATRRTNQLHRGLPRAVIESRPGLKPPIIVFAAVNAGESDRAGCRLPGVVRADELARAIGVFESQLADRPKGAEGPGEFNEPISPDDIVHAIAQRESD